MDTQQTDVIKQIAEEYAGSEDIPKATPNRVGGGGKPTIYKLLNPLVNPPEGYKFTPGIRQSVMVDTKTKEWTSSIVSEVDCVVLYFTPARQLKDKDGAKICTSWDGVHVPADQEQPKCLKTTADDVAAVLAKYKGFDAAKIDETVLQVTNQGKLCQCAFQTSSGFNIPLCKLARYDEDREQMGPCKSIVTAFCYDIRAKREFRIDITGRSAQNSKKYKAPFYEYVDYLARYTLPPYSVSLRLVSIPDGKNNILGFTNIKPIEDSGNRNDMTRLAINRKAKYIEWSTKTKAERDAAYEATKAQEAPKPKAPEVSFDAPVPPSTGVTGVMDSIDDIMNGDDIHF